jgi:hypothetical protein
VFFRFAAGLILVVLVSIASIRLEKQTLEMRRSVSVQYYQTDLLLDLLVRLRLETQRLTAPAQLAATIESANNAAKFPASNAERPRTRIAERKLDERKATDDSEVNGRLPLLRFQQAFNPEGID